MGLIFNLSLRNLFRQKRRNILLGIGISFGMMILVVANAFSHGLMDVIVNDIVSKVFGHLVIQASSGNSYFTMIRDKERIMKIIHETIPKEDLVSVDESLGMFGRAVGNGAADNMVIAGVSPNSEEKRKSFFKDYFTLVEGDFKEYFSKDIEYPVIISAQKAKSLNVKVHDVVRVRLPMVTGQMQAAQLTVIAIANSNNTFMDMVAFMDGGRVKQLMGYKPWESASLQITLKNPKRTSIHYAGIIREKLKPGRLTIAGKVAGTDCQLLAFKNDDKAKNILNRNIQIVQGDPKEAFAKDGVMISNGLAQKLHLRAGSEFTLDYPTQFREMNQEKFKVTAIYNSGTLLGGNIILVNGERIYDVYNKFLPKSQNRPEISITNPIYPALASEWKLLPRSKTSQELQKLTKEERKVKTYQSKYNVVTMYEGASQVLSMEAAMNSVTLIAVLVLFFIILIGVINTLRMTIRERTREIGTVRAIGMQKNDVKNMFIMETLLLTAFSCVAGILLGVVVMQLLGLITFPGDSALSMILKEKHLYFKLSFGSILSNFLLIMAISGLTAYFPARRAAKLSAVEALRHYE
jgi:ABC-type lipoprotein release transport system permease subunit